MSGTPNRPILSGGAAGQARRLTAGCLVLAASLGAASALAADTALIRARDVRQIDRASAADEVTIRLYARDADGAIVEHRLPESRGAAPEVARLRPVTGEELATRLRRAAETRAAALADITRASAAFRLVPEDLTRRARVFHVGVEGWTDAAFAELAARVGQIEGFSVVARAVAGSAWGERLRDIPGLVPAELPGRAYLWTEDIAEIGVDGTFHMTARMGDRELLRRTLFVDRVRRYYPEVSPAELEAIRQLPRVPGRPAGDLPPDVTRRFPDILFMIQGLVDLDEGQAAAAAVAAARGAELREAMTYLEGGNVLLGTLPGGEPYALVGRDSAAVSRALLERHHRRPVAGTEVTAAMAKDLGVAPAHLYLVEQPGVFHLDMALTLLAPGTVVLNDARVARQLQIGWMREDHEAWKPRREASGPEEQYARDLERWQEAGRALEEAIQKMTKYAERFARYEARTLTDLQATGLTVVRMAGRFLHPTLPAERDVMNFLNGEAGTNPRGETYFITQGGDPRAERHVAARLLAPGSGLDRLYVAPRLLSRETLWEKGGLGCRLKVEGAVAVSAPATRTAARSESRSGGARTP